MAADCNFLHVKQMVVVDFNFLLSWTTIFFILVLSFSMEKCYINSVSFYNIKQLYSPAKDMCIFLVPPPANLA
jgi:hypothetical protein